jgi:GTP-dependent phosphoenolpyruvate carboxykinase
VPLIRDHFARLGDHLPGELTDELDRLERRLDR